MASAVTSNLPAAAPVPVPVPVPYGWLSPRASISRDVADPVATATPEPAISKDFIDFEFSLGGSATMLPADELFADGKLLPLRKAAPSPDPEAAAAPPPAGARPEEAMPAPPSSSAEEPIKPLRAAAAADGADPYVFSPKAPSCSGRWRELLGLKRAADARSPSAAKGLKASAAAKTPAPAARSAAARSLKLLLQRNAGRAADPASAPLLRDSSDSEASLSLASSRFSLSSSSSSSGHDHDHDDASRLSLDSAAADPNPPRIRLVRSSHSHCRHRHSTSSGSARSPARRRPSPPPPRCLSVDSPRMNSSGKIVFQAGLERISSSPCSFHAAAPRPRSRAVDRSYSSAGVRAAPVVLNVSVCPRPVFGFFKDRKDSSARSSLGRRAPPPQGWSGELAR